MQHENDDDVVMFVLQFQFVFMKLSGPDRVIQGHWVKATR